MIQELKNQVQQYMVKEIKPKEEEDSSKIINKEN